jgi:cytochrome c oxidase subunit III
MNIKSVVRDVSQLPTYASGPKNPLWWGTQFFMLMEGLGFVFGYATYLYLYEHNKSWPLGAKPELLWPTLLLALFLLSEIPNVWVKKMAQKHDVKKVKIGLVVMSVIGIIGILLRMYEIGAIKIRWNDNAYGSIFWYLIGYHTLHLLTDVSETIVMTVNHFIGPVDMRRFSEVEDNQDYWHFVVVFWAITYAFLYWIPRWWGMPL